MRITWIAIMLAGACSSGAAGPTPAPAPSVEPTLTASTIEINPRLLRRFRPVAAIDQPPPATPQKIALGRALFYEARLSRRGQTSCNSCHALDRYGVDGKPRSLGGNGHPSLRNAPSVYNAASHFAQFWDGRVRTVEEQARDPILNRDEMAMPDEAAVLATLRGIPEYVAGFAAAFPGDPAPITMAHLGEAIGAFERGLVTRSRWDDFLAGKPDALTQQERRGLRVFLDSGCMVCHTGPQVGGTMFERVGVVEPWPNQSDPGRAGITKADADRMVFKVPSLKNIAMTAPYFHDGSIGALDDAIRLMGRHQLGIELSAEEIGAIAAWMSAMTGEIDRSYIDAPPPVAEPAPRPARSQARG